MADDVYSLSKANSILAESYGQLGSGLAEAASKSKVWNVVSRMTSGSGFWKVQNKFRAIADAVSAYNENITKNIEEQEKMAKTHKMLYELQENMPTRRKMEEGGVGKVVGGEQYDPEELKKMDEFKQSIGVYEEAGLTEQDLLNDIAGKLDKNNELTDKMKKKAVEELKYSKLSWTKNPFRKAWMWFKKKFSFVWSVVKMLGKMLLQASIGFLLLILLLPLAIKFFKNFKQILANFGVSVGLDDLKNGFKFVVEILGKLWEILKLAMGGNIGAALRMYVFDVLIPVGKKILKLIVLGVKVFAALAGALLATIWKGAFNAIIKLVNKLPGVNIPLLAKGGHIGKGGLAIVGEKGPELVSLPTGATVHSNNQSRNMGNTIHVHVNGRVGASDAEIRDIASKVAREIGLQMNRTSSAVGRF